MRLADKTVLLTGAGSGRARPPRSRPPPIAVPSGPKGVPANAICPGPILTPMLESLFPNEEEKMKRLNRIPMGRFGRAAAVVYAALLPPPPPPPPATPTPGPALSPCEAVPPLPTTLSDQPNLYSISVPEGWAVVTDEGAMGVQVSRISVESPDFSLFIDEAAEGPFSPYYYETGAVFIVHMSRAILSPPSKVEKKCPWLPCSPASSAAAYHVFKEPSTFAGQLL